MKKRTCHHGYTKNNQREDALAIHLAGVKPTARKFRAPPKKYPHSGEKQRERYLRQGKAGTGGTA